MFDKTNNTSRRKMLKIAGSGLVMGGLGTTASASSSKKELSKIYEQARKVRRKSDSQERFIQYLQAHDIELTIEESMAKKPIHAKTSESEDVSTEKVESADLMNSLVIGDDGADAFADYCVNISGGYGTGERADDALSLSWPSDDYDLKSNGAYIEDGPRVTLRQSGFNGAYWSYEDNYACGYGCDATFYVGVNLERLTDETPRKVQATYQSLWNDDTWVSGMSVGLDGSVTFSLTQDSETNIEQIERLVARDYS